MNYPGRLILLIGSSGVGKGSILKRLFRKYPELVYSVSVTTRKPRAKEIEGVHYHFVSVDEFEKMQNNGEFLEWAEYAGNFYGTLKQSVINYLEQGKSVILEIEIEGAKQITDQFPDALSIFILPPSFRELERRLRTRQTEDADSIEKRLWHAKREMVCAGEFNFQIVNDDVEITVKDIEFAIFG